MAQIFIPTPLRKFTDNQASITLKSAFLKDALAELSKAYPSIQEHIFDEQGTLRGFVRIFIGEEDIEDLKGLDTPIEPSDVISIIPAIAGG